jgi:hypothetical protein
MKSRTTLLLVILVAVVGGLVLLDRFKGTPTDEAKQKARHILDFNAGDVTKLELSRTNQTIVLEKSGENWDIKSPLAVRADAGAVNSILAELEFAERDRTLNEKELAGVNLVDFGLTPPRARVTIHDKKGARTLLIGTETPTKDALYAQLEGRKPIFITRKSVADRLNLPLDNLRSRAAVEFNQPAVTRLEIRTTDRIVELAKSPEAIGSEPRWNITRPLAARADERKVGELLSDLGALQIQAFISEDPKDVHTYQLDEHEREVTVWMGETGKTLLLGHPTTNDASKVYAKLKSADSIFTVSTSATQKFAVQINDLRDAHVLNFMPVNVHTVDITREGEHISITRSGEAWQVTEPITVAADEGTMNGLLDQLHELRATQFVADVATDLDKFGLASPVATVNLLGTGTNSLAQLLLGAVDSSNSVRFAKRADEPFIYGVDTNIFGVLPSNVLAVRTLWIREISPDQITRVEIQKPASQFIAERHGTNAWHLVEPAQGALDLDGLQQLIESFSHLHVDRFIGAHTNVEPSEATVKVFAGEKTYTLVVGQPTETGARYASWSDPPLMFVLPSASADRFLKPLVAVPAAAGPN